MLAAELAAGRRAVAMEVSSHALALGRVRGHPLRGRHLHEPVARPPRLPPRPRRLLRGEGVALHPGLRRRSRRQPRRPPWGRAGRPGPRADRGLLARRRHRASRWARRPAGSGGAAQPVELAAGRALQREQRLAAATAAARLGIDVRHDRRRPVERAAGARALRAGRRGPAVRGARRLRPQARRARRRPRGRPRGSRRRPGAGRVRRGRRPRPHQAGRDGRGGGSPGRSGTPDLRQPERRGSAGHHRRHPVRAWPTRPAPSSSPTARPPSRLAIAEASPGDVVLIAGKGHEAVQVVGDEELPFDDREVARAALRSRRGSAP